MKRNSSGALDWRNWRLYLIHSSWVGYEAFEEVLAPHFFKKESVYCLSTPSSDPQVSNGVTHRH